MAVEKLIVDHIDTWTTALQTRSTAGRGSSGKIDLYGIKKLRELILELAVRGKLVPQDPNDEPASVLLERIAAEKAELVKQGKIKKQKPLPEISEEEKPFELPAGWEWVRLGTLFNSIQSGGTPSKINPAFWGGDIPWASVKDLGSSQYISKTQDYITEAGLLSGSKLADSGDVLICTRMGLGKIAIASCPIAFNQDLKAVKLTSHIIPNFFFNTYSTVKIKGTGTTVEGIKQEQLVNYITGFPPFNEQNKIVVKVKELMSLCDQLEQHTLTSLDAHQQLVETLLTTLTDSQNADELAENWARISKHFDTLFTTEASIDALKQTILQLAVMGKLVPQDPNDEPASELLKRIAQEKAQLVKDGKIKKQKPLPPVNDEDKLFEIPFNWEHVYLNDICEVITDGTHQTPKYTDRGRPFISAQCVKPFKFMPENCRYVSEEDYQQYIKNRTPEINDILLARVGAGIGECAVIDVNLEFSIYVSTALIKPIKCHINSNYLCLWLNSPIGRLFSSRYTYGKGVSQGNLNLSLIRTFVISIPPYKEQNLIVEKVRTYLSICEKLKSKIQSAQQTQLHLADALTEAAIN
ncbi:TPA: restriction endonuclease subunit S [Klebsiella pneumoniae]|jgi:type I restriction enzyme S subunit|uniref:Subunit S of type I restriction-modification system n=6 Tax=Klebsiella pneumoniae TaxID=573 RepID=A0A378CFL6_KLEPN|nr:restriction endonuclease subunit S [Klebsiella pneumoniae]AXT68023.1 restriction endonuclease subunit S [Klebsiella pneumoniae]EIW5061060.1 restriction endonuclease subunit S [Klebsiella pneumoniae]EIW5065458.1 restriction endonuclease subunit S [Klebsiella pneumoniae]EIX9472272.1 restriction endonuclease subunit S [Klebsiella pneumoniae]EIX9475672.1 restriction endonuclease subunit S [Klebsiella pneumoniae]